MANLTMRKPEVFFAVVEGEGKDARCYAEIDVALGHAEELAKRIAVRTIEVCSPKSRRSISIYLEPYHRLVARVDVTGELECFKAGN